MPAIGSYTNLSAPDGLEEVVVSDTTNALATKNITSAILMQDNYTTKSVAGSSNVALTAAESMNKQLVLSGTLTGNINVTVPDAREMVYNVTNNCDGAFTLTFKTVSGTGVVLGQGSVKRLLCDGTNISEPVLSGMVPIGTIIAYMPGYFDDGVNTTFAFDANFVSANTIAAAQTAVNPSGFYVCDGTRPYEDGGILSSALMATGRYTPDLTGNIFIMGDTVNGGIGGGGTVDISHVHTGPSHTHTGPSHTHTGPSHKHKAPVGDGSGSAMGHPSSAPFGTSGTINNTLQTNPSSGPGSAACWTTDSEGTGTTSSGGAGATGAGGTGNTGSGGSATLDVRPNYIASLYIMRIE